MTERHNPDLDDVFLSAAGSVNGPPRAKPRKKQRAGGARDAIRRRAFKILAAIAEHAGAKAPAPAAPAARGARPTVVAAVTSIFREVDARIARASGGAVGLGVLVPAALTLWAARELLRGRARPLAWSSALWYAHSLFREYALPTRED